MLLINEVYPNPLSGSEWVELFFQAREGQSSPPSLINFSLEDNNQLIYLFDGEEVWVENLMLIEVTKLNNDQDSVVFKNDQNEILDQMSYLSSQKGQSWSRSSPDDNQFSLTEPSPLEENFPAEISPSPSAGVTITPAATPTPAPSITASLTPTPSPTSKSTPPPSTQFSPRSEPPASNQLFSNYQQFKNIKLSSADQSQEQRHTRLAIIGQKAQKSAIINAIMGSSLLVLAAQLLFYDRRKQKK